MANNPDDHDRMPPDRDLHGQPEIDPEVNGEDEEIPLSVMIILVVLAVGIAVVYLTLGGGHSHFH